MQRKVAWSEAASVRQQTINDNKYMAGWSRTDAPRIPARTCLRDGESDFSGLRDLQKAQIHGESCSRSSSQSDDGISRLRRIQAWFLELCCIEWSGAQAPCEDQGIQLAQWPSVLNYKQPSGSICGPLQLSFAKAWSDLQPDYF